MELYDAKRLALSLMSKHGLVDWQFRFDGAMLRFGICRHRSKIISVSKHLVGLNDQERVQNTLLHEIAHALVGRGHRHDTTWKRMAKKIGAEPVAHYPSWVKQPAPKYIGKCPTCLMTHKRFKKPREGVACADCCGGRYDPKHKIIWQQ